MRAVTVLRNQAMREGDAETVGKQDTIRVNVYNPIGRVLSLGLKKYKTSLRAHACEVRKGPRSV